MQYLQIQTQDHMALVGLNRGKSNALNADMIREMQRLLKDMEQDDSIAGMILHGQSGFFCSGLDLIELYEYSAEEIRDFWILFLEFTKQFVSFRKPAIAAINGHSPAGGCVLALCCDYRIMQEGEFIIGLNEIPVGIVVPESIFNLYSFWLGQANAYRYLMEGKLVHPTEALKIGLVDEVVGEKQIRSRAERQLSRYIQLDANTWQLSKLNIRKTLINQMGTIDKEMLNGILKQWWSPSTRSILKTIIKNLTGDTK